jgi:hypothetical protein
LWIEAFVIFNYLALVLDIYIAHSSNSFRRSEEYIPLYFSAAAALLLALGLTAREKLSLESVWRDLGYLTGWISVIVGIAGVVYHLDSQFFYEKTLKSLTYAAPFAAPLAYTGLGLLLIMNRMVEPASREWASWLILLAAGGYFGNFVLSLADHAADGFFRPVEWLPVISAAFATSFLLIPVFMTVRKAYLRTCGGVLLIQGLVGVLGFFFHAQENMRMGSIFSFETIVNGAPPMAPLLFPNLIPLGIIGLWALYLKSSDSRITRP